MLRAPERGATLSKNDQYDGCDYTDELGVSGSSSFAIASIQSAASSEMKKPVGPLCPTHQASDVIDPPAAVISATIPAGTASPLFSIGHSRVDGFTFGHHCSVLMFQNLPLERHNLPSTLRTVAAHR